jgi:hypothetical protein
MVMGLAATPKAMGSAKLKVWIIKPGIEPKYTNKPGWMGSGHCLKAKKELNLKDKSQNHERYHTGIPTCKKVGGRWCFTEKG